MVPRGRGGLSITRNAVPCSSRRLSPLLGPGLLTPRGRRRRSRRCASVSSLQIFVVPSRSMNALLVQNVFTLEKSVAFLKSIAPSVVSNWSHFILHVFYSPHQTAAEIASFKASRAAALERAMQGTDMSH